MTRILAWTLMGGAFSAALLAAPAQTNLSEILWREMDRLKRPDTPSSAPKAAVPPNPQALDERELAVLRLIPGDTLELRVFREPAMDLTSATVDPQGTIAHPFLGIQIPVAGRTVAEAEAQIHEILLRDYLVDPRITLRLLQMAPAKYTVDGSVEAPDSFTLDRRRPPTVAEAVERAGGPTSRAATKVLLERGTGAERRTTRVELDRLPAEPPLVEPGDRLIVLEQWP